ncbi:MAG: hypothetical protein COB77_00900 [Gammaproteobacteria bacterium]|nr:MAG: hypothetical protein COB77_00900 [Gammaproteobacteria bacterium]
MWTAPRYFVLSIYLLPCHLIASSPNDNFQPFEIRDQNLFNLIHGQPLPTNAHLNNKNQGLWSSSLVITNTLNIETSNNESIYLDYEAYRLNVSYQYGLNEKWDIKFTIPLIHQTGGFLDTSIDNWHEIFNLPRANRPFVENNQYEANYTIAKQSLVNLDATSTSLGDVQISLAHSLIAHENTTVSLWGNVKLPTGNKNKLSGNGATDISAWLAINQQLSENWVANINAGTVVLGDNTYQNIPLSEYTFFGHLMLGWSFNDYINVKAQLQGHTSYYDESQLKILGDTYFLSFGTSIKINACQQLDFSISEDIKVDASPDASLLISWRGYSSGC